MKRLALAALLGAVVALGVDLSGCFTPTYADCAFRCGSEDPKCPAEYECRSDGYCHLPDSTAICAIPKLPDLSLSSSPDLADPVDADTSTDGP